MAMVFLLLLAALCVLPACAVSCEESIVGAGWAGVYFAYRRATTHPNPSTICLFEASGRIGGRTYSVAVEGTPFTIDVGAYRFSPDMHLPGDLIMKDLKLPTACYEPHCPSAKLDFPPPFQFNYSAPMRRIVDPKTGFPSGYVSAMKEMVGMMLDKGVQVFTKTSLVGLEGLDQEGSSNLILQGPKAAYNVSSKVVMLNLPRNKLFQVAGLQQALPKRTEQMLRCVKFDRPAHLFGNWSSLLPHSALSKAYFYYEDAWWYTKINKTIGQFPKNAFIPVEASNGVFIGIHWNDGPVKCTSPTKCSGFLEAYYSVSNESFFWDLSGTPADPLGHVKKGDATSNAALLKAHTGLMEAITPILKQKGVDPSSLAPPDQMIIGVWDRPNPEHPLGQGYTAPTKVYYAPEISGSLGSACGVSGLTEGEYAETVLQPLGKKVPVFLANNDYAALNVWYMFGDWAEESLLQAERALRRLQVAKPEWLDSRYYAAKIDAVP